MDKASPPFTGTREPQYNRCLEIKKKQGLTPLGLMTNQVWEDDPRRLTFLLARYKFVSKMLSGKKFVGELGCGDAFGTRIVMQSTEKVVTYDFDPLFVEDIRQRRSERWPVEVHFHDILEAPLPNKHDGIYSLDVIEHIPRVEEHSYLNNLCDSLTDDGVLIIGSPSLESQTYASPPSKEGHVNCKSGEELKALLKNYFENVFLFSMNDEVVHTGFTPMAHYLFAVCCQKKRSETRSA
jgi:2-polyprenyl-3-methyl-5-hydroxy-6-metoxy-1,4-benzoquinol methylase